MKGNRVVKIGAKDDGFEAIFFKNGKKFYASLVYNIYVGRECMIFAFKNKREIDWSGVYCKRDIEVSAQSLLACVEEFLKE